MYSEELSHPKNSIEIYIINFDFFACGIKNITKNLLEKLFQFFFLSHLFYSVRSIIETSDKQNNGMAIEREKIVCHTLLFILSHIPNIQE